MDNKNLYIQDTSWGFGVFRSGYMIAEFETESEAYTYMICLRGGDID